MGSTVFRPTDLREIATELRVTPADALLARRFLVVEGASDGAILSHWARLGGRSREDAGTRFGETVRNAQMILRRALAQSELRGRSPPTFSPGPG